MPDEHIKFWDKFEQQGEDAVRQNLNLGSYGGRKRQYAIAWLEENRQRRISESEDRDNAFKREQIEIAREATNAAWEAARAARTVCKCSGADFAALRKWSPIYGSCFPFPWLRILKFIFVLALSI